MEYEIHPTIAGAEPIEEGDAVVPATWRETKTVITGHKLTRGLRPTQERFKTRLGSAGGQDSMLQLSREPDMSTEGNDKSSIQIELVSQQSLAATTCCTMAPEPCTNQAWT